MGSNQARPVAVGVPVATATPTAGEPAVTIATATATPTAGEPAVTNDNAKRLDLVFTMDCTGSMGQYIAAAKNGIVRITERLAQAEGYDLRYGLVAYRDHPPQDQTFVTKTFPFTSSLASMQASLSTLSASGGGDGPEAVAAALKATCDIAWREDATKVVVLIADAPPHGLGENGDGFPNGGPDGVDPLVVLDAMSAKGITIYSVGCQPALSSYMYATEFFIACAQRTNGQAVALGSAASLADVILGASVEEMDLEALTHEVQQMTAQFRTAQPAMADEEVQQRVHMSLQERGIKTRKVGGARLTSEFSAMVSEAPSLAAAKTSLLASKKAAPARLRHQPFGGAPLSSKAAIGRRRSVSPSSPTELACSMDEVELEEDAISMEQVSRLYGRGKKKGLW